MALNKDLCHQPMRLSMHLLSQQVFSLTAVMVVSEAEERDSNAYYRNRCQEHHDENE